MRRPVVAAAFLAALSIVPVASTAYTQSQCLISEGTSIAGVHIGMSLSAALAITGQPTGKQTSGTETIYTLRAPWSHMVVDSGIVRRVATRSAQCRTASGLGPGSVLESVRGAYADTASSLASGGEGDVLTYPFIGIAFILKDNRVGVVEVFPGERMARSQPQPPQPVRRPESTASGVYVWGNTINSRYLGPIGSSMLVGPFRSFASCIAFLALMQREGANLGFVSPTRIVLDVIDAGGLFCVQFDDRGNVATRGQASMNSNVSPDRGWIAGGVNSQGYFLGIGPVRTRESCSIILGAMHREGAAFAYIGIAKIITQAVTLSSLSCMPVGQ